MSANARWLMSSDKNAEQSGAFMTQRVCSVPSERETERYVKLLIICGHRAQLARVRASLPNPDTCKQARAKPIEFYSLLIAILGHTLEINRRQILSARHAMVSLEVLHSTRQHVEVT